MSNLAKVEDIMTREVVTLSPDDTLDYASRLFSSHDLDGFPVVGEHKKLVGIVTTYDMVFQSSQVHLPALLDIIGDMQEGKLDRGALSGHFNKIKSIKVDEIMNLDPLTISPDVRIEDLAKEFTNHHRVNPIPVVNKDKQLLGVVSRFDVIKFFNEQYMEKIFGDREHSGVLKRLGESDVDLDIDNDKEDEE
ncbi:MAG: hypothetical protein COV29_00825 [Candidatus Yanofskybacteria bacterium CG10_big_fil_rev_8_21_14_0_10_36_16]|uniref:CBS domain-containing protein n=1 Tax=Candidatus Yanofskybacteria bacterium CG10_big_fil_rev_8_21_14_0_10_36_16 TaxID=1975096 RepID=A0A2J0Q830_9BACT|nr:MAG: hypothetical protein COV29_00825 [Candidatus Yanofskybacteria bacterium CG10_big_fil_rev_8_21_14_0_10_36_16]